ncbi:Hypothetical protein GLP15_537 [Giardia lamblia P15]|uniref:ASF1 like histone chaperone n=1 Tax=Giardia intestinalis (strain P15) TaxID=658858 RepID=E1F8I8_GIAIA|nr:Hypothetical protein GLP15_537 [Giardia lamblia P15]
MEQVILFDPPSIKVLNPETPFLEPLSLEVKLHLLEQLSSPLIWSVEYVDGISPEQSLIQVPIGPSAAQKLKFVLTVPPPTPSAISVSGLLTSAAYNITVQYKESYVWSTALYLLCTDTSGKHRPPVDEELSGDSIHTTEPDTDHSQDDEVASHLLEDESEDSENQTDDGSEAIDESSLQDSHPDTEPEIKKASLQPLQMGSKDIFSTFIKTVTLLSRETKQGIYTLGSNEAFS